MLKKGLGLQKINQVRICHAGNWKKKHLRSFQNAYANASFLTDHVALLKQVFSSMDDRLLDLNLKTIDYITDYLRIETRMVLMSELGGAGKGI